MAHQWQPAFDPQAAEGDDNHKALAVHIALLPVGSLGALVYFSGNRWDTNNHRSGNVDHTVLFDYASRTAVRPGSPAGPGGLQPNNLLDVFCSGHALLPDGRLLVAGGTSAMAIGDAANPHEGHWGGLREAFAFDPVAVPAWQPVAEMNTCPVAGFEGRGGGRWYPSLVTLADGSVLALCGHPRVFNTTYDEADPATYPATEDDPRHNNNSPERFRSSLNAWQLLNPDGLGEGFLHDFAVFYPRAHVLPSGRLLIVQPLYTNPGDGSIDASGAWAHKSLVYDADGQMIVAGFAGPDAVEGDYLNPGYAAQPTTSVLLPLLPEEQYSAHVLVCGGKKAARATIPAGNEASATWTPTSARNAFFNQGGTNTVPPRANALATLLPTGQVLVTGGTNVWKDPSTIPGNQFDQLFGVRVPELYDPQTDTWAALTDAPATVTRGYHSVALLMPDGRVLTAGSERNNIFGAGNAEYRMEVFEPDYISAPQRLQITSAPPCIAYGESFDVNFQLAAGTAFPSITRVAITRFGSATHGFDYDQRYVGLDFQFESPGRLRVSGPPNGGIAPPGYYMLWLVDNGGRPCVQAATVRVGSQQLRAEMDRSVFSIYEVQANQVGATHSTTFQRAFYAVFDGFIPTEVLGLTPTAAFSQAGLSATLAPSGVIANPALEDNAHPQLIQRTVFAFDLTFSGTDAFNGLSSSDASRSVTVTIVAGGWSATGNIELVMEPSPFMLDGQPPWLSVDLRVFQITPSSASQWLPGHSFTTPNDYISQLLQRVNGNVGIGQTMFATLPSGEATSALSLLPTTTGAPDGPPIYSFALARVRMDSQSVPADFVRVLFRLFRTLRPSLTYDTATLYRRAVLPLMVGGTEVTTDAIPLLGLDGSDIISIPFFAAPRVGVAQDMATQPDPDNLQTIPSGTGEQFRFFGCWLDINQPNQKHFPRHPGNATSFGGVPPGDLLSIQELITGFHQCLVAEVHYKLDPMALDLPRPGESPSTSDKLSQRNLALTTSANPGTAPTRTVQHSFEFKPMGAAYVQAGTGQKAPVAVRGDVRPDSLLLWWGNLPRQTKVDIFLPGVAASDVMQLIPAAHANLLQAIDDHTLRCAPGGQLGDCLFLPLPPSRRTPSLAGLLTLRLPAGVHHGQRFRVVGQHLSGARRQIVGAFELDIAVDADHAHLLLDDIDQLAIAKHSLALTPTSDRWWPVIARMVAQLGERVAAFGGDPHAVFPSPWDGGPHAPISVGQSGECPLVHERCEEAGHAVQFIAEAIVPEGLEVDIDVRATIRLRVKRLQD